MAILISATALLVAYKGTEFARFDLISRSLEDMTRPQSQDSPGSLFAIDKALNVVGSYRDMAGLRHLARKSYRTAERRLEPASPEAMTNALAVVEAGPSDSWPWLDLARVAWRNEATRDLSIAALELSALTGPFEADIMEVRARFVFAIWPNATPVQRRRAAQDVAAMLQVPTISFTRGWRRLIAALPEQQRNDVNEEIRKFYPTYVPPIFQNLIAEQE